MQRRRYFKLFAGLAAGLGLRPAAAAPAPRRAIRLLDCPLAGFQHHEGETLWKLLATGQPLKLVREADNPYDARAVRVDWFDRTLGYLPKGDNASVAQLLDRGEPLRARIAGLRQADDPWKRVRLEVLLKEAG